MPVPRQVPRGGVLHALGQRAEVHHEVGDGRLDHFPLLGVRAVDIEGLGDVGEQAFACPGSPLAPPMWGMPAPLRHCDIMSNAPLCSFAVAPLPRITTHFLKVNAIDVDAFVGRRGIGNDGVVGEGDKAGHPHAEHGLHGNLELLGGEARW